MIIATDFWYRPIATFVSVRECADRTDLTDDEILTAIEMGDLVCGLYLLPTVELVVWLDQVEKALAPAVFGRSMGLDDVAELLGCSRDHVNQVAGKFRRLLRERLDRHWWGVAA